MGKKHQGKMNEKGYRRQGKFSVCDAGLISVKEERKRRKTEGKKESEYSAVQIKKKKISGRLTATEQRLPGGTLLRQKWPGSGTHCHQSWVRSSSGRKWL